MFTLVSLGITQFATDNPQFRPLPKNKNLQAQIKPNLDPKANPDLKLQTENELNSKTLLNPDIQLFAKEAEATVKDECGKVPVEITSQNLKTSETDLNFQTGFLPEEYYSEKYLSRPQLISDIDGNVKLYRTISNAEYKAIKTNCKFSTMPGTMSDKWFSTKIEDAYSWGEKMNFGENYKIIEVTVPDSLIDILYYGGPNLDGIGPAFCAPLDVINEFSSTIKLVKG